MKHHFTDLLDREDERKWQDFMKEEESKFIELIESDKWTLIDHNNEIVRRWNF